MEPNIGQKFLDNSAKMVNEIRESMVEVLW